MADRLDVALLRKVWAMAERGTPGEQAAARARAQHMLAPHGHALADVPRLLDEEQARLDAQLADPAYLLRQAERSGRLYAARTWSLLSAGERRVLDLMDAVSAHARIRDGKSVVDLVDEAAGAVLVPAACTRRTIERLASRRLVDPLNPATFAISDKGRGVLLYRYAPPWTGQD